MSSFVQKSAFWLGFFCLFSLFGVASLIAFYSIKPARDAESLHALYRKAIKQKVELEESSTPQKESPEQNEKPPLSQKDTPSVSFFSPFNQCFNHG